MDRSIQSSANRPKQDYRTTSPLKFLTSTSNDVFSRTADYGNLANSIKADNLWSFGATRLARKGGRILVKTETDEQKWLIDAASNDYLGLSHNLEIISSVTEAIVSYGVGAQGASMLGGNTPIHRDLENELADFLGKEAVMVGSSGYAVMIAACQGLLYQKDVVFYDSFCHQSLVDGMSLSGSKMYKYPHNDIKTLHELVEKYRHKYRGAMIVTDGVCSTNGSIAPIAELSTLSKQHHVRLFVDDAHGIGTLNAGRGCTANHDVDLVGGVLSKTFASAGGFLAGSREVIDYVRFFGNATCATTNISIANAATGLAALRLIRREPERVDALTNRVCFIREALAKEGCTVLDRAPIISIVCGSDVNAYHAWRDMFDGGVLAHALPFPIAPFEQAQLRLRINMALEDQDVADIIKAISHVVKNRASF